MKRVLFIVNPRSGKGSIKYHILDILDTFSKKGIDVTVHITQERLDACRTAMEEGGNYDEIVLSGGDGTLDEVVSGLMKGGHDTPVGYIPAGSTNDFAASLGLPKTPEDAADAVVNGRPHAIDAGDFGGELFCYVAAFGAFSAVSYETPQNMKNAMGHLAYIIEGVKRLPIGEKYPARVEVGDQVFEEEFLFCSISNTTSIGGFWTKAWKPHWTTANSRCCSSKRPQAWRKRTPSSPSCWPGISTTS